MTASGKFGIVIAGHGSRDPDAVREFEALVELVVDALDDNGYLTETLEEIHGRLPEELEVEAGGGHGRKFPEHDDGMRLPLAADEEVGGREAVGGRLALRAEAAPVASAEAGGGSIPTRAARPAPPCPLG